MNLVVFLRVCNLEPNNEEIQVKYIKMICVATISLVLLQGCNDDDDKKTQEAQVVTIVDAAVSNGSFTTLVTALQATGLDRTLSDPSKKFTVFAPTDDAFSLLGEETINALLADTTQLSNILSYHVIEGEVNAEKANSLAGTVVDMVNGDRVGLSLDGDSLLVNLATVITTDINTDNGIIHVIDAVLLPPSDMTEPSQNIVETAVADGRFTTLVNALKATGLDAVLADGAGQFTVFAPTDAAFALIEQATLKALVDNSDVLSQVLLGHVLSQSVNSISAYALSGNDVSTASMSDVALSINTATDRLLFGGANVVVKDIYTTNGIIHVIDAVVVGDVELPKPAMSLVDVASANGSFTTLVSALQATGLDATLANLDNDYTVFAPTDAAFAKLPEGTVASLSTDQLSDILLYHVLPDKVMADGAIALAQSNTNMTNTVNGQMLALSFTESMLFANGAKVSNADVMADNGVIHVVDNVLLPPMNKGAVTQNIVEVVLADPDNFSTLATALTTAGLVSTLADDSATFTVFAPTNAAFDLIDSEALSALLADTTELANVLLTHVVGESEISSLAAFAANGKSIATLSGTNLAVSVNATSGQLMIGSAHVTVQDIYTTNGVIHVIDAVILD